MLPDYFANKIYLLTLTITKKITNDTQIEYLTSLNQIIGFDYRIESIDKDLMLQ